MELREIIRHLQALDQHIAAENTGPLKQLAKRMRLTEPFVDRLLSTLKKLGAPVAFSEVRQTYFYDYPGELSIGFSPAPRGLVLRDQKECLIGSCA